MSRRTELMASTVFLLVGLLIVLGIRFWMVGSLWAAEGEGAAVDVAVVFALIAIVVAIIGLGVFLGTTGLRDDEGTTK